MFWHCETKNSGSPFVQTKKFLNTQTPKNFEIPFLREHDFFENIKTKIFCDAFTFRETSKIFENANFKFFL